MQRYLRFLILGAWATVLAEGAKPGPTPEPIPPRPPSDEEFTIWPFALLSIILVLSILFDLGKNAVEHSTPDIFEPIVEAFFSELATLGFIGALAFLMTYNFNSDCNGACSVMQRLSEHFLGNEEELQELFEQLHFLLFAVSVVFIFVVLLLLRISLRKGAQWADWEYQLSHTDQKSTSGKKLAKQNGSGIGAAMGFNSNTVHNLMSFVDSDNGSFWSQPQWLLPEWVKTDAQSQSEYYRFRHRFIDDDEEVVETQMDSDFDFGMYLKLTLAHTFAEIIEIKPVDWFVLWCAFGVLFLLYFFQPGLILWTVLLAEVGMFLFSLVVQSKLFKIRQEMLPDVSTEVGSRFGSDLNSELNLPSLIDDNDNDAEEPSVTAPLLGSSGRANSGSRDGLIQPAPLKSGELASPKRSASPEPAAASSGASNVASGSESGGQFASTSTVTGRKGRMSAASGISLSAPKYLRTGSKAASTFQKLPSSKTLLEIKKKDKKGDTNNWEKFVAVICWPFLLFASPVQPNKHQRLFWFGRKGHAFLIHTLKLLMFGSVIIVANVCVKMQGDLMSRSVWLFVAALMPPILTLMTVPLSIQTLNFVTAIELMKHEKLVIEVIKHQRYEKQKKVIHILTSLQFFLDKAEQLSIDTKAEDGSEDPHKKVEPVKTMFARLVKSRSTRHLVDDLRELFDSFDSDGSGNIDREELGLLLQQMGQQKEPEEVDRLFNLMDADGSGDVDFEEFACVILQNKSAKKNLDPTSMAERMWKLFDMDGDGSISPDEMIEAFQRLGKNWDVNEIRSFLHDIDADKSGTIEKQEFVDFVVESMGGHRGGGHGHGAPFVLTCVSTVHESDFSS